MNRIYIVSRCQGHEKGYYRFHFIGYLNGIRITRVLIKGYEFLKNEDYVVAIENIRNVDDTLYGKCVKAKKLF